MIILLTSILLLLSFAIHVCWWKVRIPLHTTKALLWLFLITPLTAAAYYLLVEPSLALSIHDTLRIALLYTSCSFVYIILYSAIEQQSPTLSMIDYIYQHKDMGCPDDALKHHLAAKNEMTKRLDLMVTGDWLTFDNDYWQLTQKGKNMGQLFDRAASILGLKIGG